MRIRQALEDEIPVKQKWRGPKKKTATLASLPVLPLLSVVASVKFVFSPRASNQDGKTMAPEIGWHFRKEHAQRPTCKAPKTSCAFKGCPTLFDSLVDFGF